MTWTPEDPGGLDGEDAALLALLAPADAKVGPARRLPAEAFRDLYVSAVDEVLEARRAEPGAAAPRRLEPTRDARQLPPPRAASRWLRPLAFAAAALLAFSVAPGAGAIALRLLDVHLGSAELTPAPAAPATDPRRPARTAPAPLAVEHPSPALDDVAVPRSALEAEPARTSRPPRKRRVAVARPAPDPGVVTVPADRPPEDLLAIANERRQRRDWPGADAFYGAVASRFPGTDAAVVATIASATLHLQHLADAPGALTAYRRALGWRPTGPLAEDARWGIAEVHQSLGDTRAEAAALRDFLERHPRSTLADAARRRLAQLTP
jgi:hypothetical protein